jgi:hypothetical protein
MINITIREKESFIKEVKNYPNIKHQRIKNTQNVVGNFIGLYPEEYTGCSTTIILKLVFESPRYKFSVPKECYGKN